MRLVIKEIETCSDDCGQTCTYADIENCMLPKIKNTNKRLVMMEINNSRECPYYMHSDFSHKRFRYCGHSRNKVADAKSKRCNYEDEGFPDHCPLEKIM